MEIQHIIHNFEPIYNEHSKILMLGTMPSPKSREVGFYYGADDSSIRNPQPNDMSRILECADIKAIFTTGTKAFQLYRKFCYPKTGIMAIGLPSTSPANCRMSYEQLFEAYSEIKKYM